MQPLCTDLPNGLFQCFGNDCQILSNALVQADRLGIHSGANSQLLHVHAWARVKQGTALSQRNHTDCSIAALHQNGSDVKPCARKQAMQQHSC